MTTFAHLSFCAWGVLGQPCLDDCVTFLMTGADRSTSFLSLSIDPVLKRVQCAVDSLSPCLQDSTVCQRSILLRLCLQSPPLSSNGHLDRDLE